MKTRLLTTLVVIGLLSAAVPLPARAALSMYPTSGPVTGGTVVTIVGGSGYSVSTTVGICGLTRAPTTISNDGSSLTFTTPPCSTVGLAAVTTQTPETIGLPGFNYTAAVPGAVTLSPSSGPKGTMVTLSAPGQGPFTASTTLTVDGLAPPQLLATSATTLLFEVPDAATAGAKVVATTSPPTIGIPAFQYTVPGVSMSPTIGPTTGGTVVTLTGSVGAFDYYCRVTGFSLTLNPTSISVDGARMTFVTPAGTGTANVAVAAASGAPSAACHARGLSASTFTFSGSGTPGGGTPYLSPTSGPIGTVISILNGWGLTTATTVSVCGVTVFPTSISAGGTSLTFVAPTCTIGSTQVVSTANPGYASVGSFTFLAGTPIPPSPPSPGVPVAVPVVYGVSPASGPVAGGNTVTVSGANFQVGARVAFGTVASAAVSFVSSTALTARVPAGTGTVAVTVQNPDGYAGQLAGAYTYTGGGGYTCVAGTATGVAPMNAAYSVTTKVVRPGQYVTYRFSCTSAAAGAHITILGARKASSGAWSPFTAFTSRIADASGNALFHVRMASPSWWSFRAQVGGVYSNAVQSRWMN